MSRKLFVKSMLVKLMLVVFVGAAFAAAAGRHMISQRNKSFSQGSITVQRGDSVTFKNEDDVMIMTEKGMAIRLHCKDVSVISRNTQGVRLVRLEEGDKVAAVASVVSEEAEIKV